MSALRQRGFMVIDGPFRFNEIAKIASDYDHAFAVTPDAQIKRGRTSTRWGGLVAWEPFYRIYLHEPLLSAASERIGGPMKLSSFHARTLLPNVAVEPPHQDVAPGADGYPLVAFIFMVDEFRPDNGATRFIAGSQNGPRPPTDAVACDACGRAGSMLIFDGTTWHGHGANRTDSQRRSIQGAFIPQNHTAACRWGGRVECRAGEWAAGRSATPVEPLRTGHAMSPPGQRRRIWPLSPMSGVPLTAALAADIDFGREVPCVDGLELARLFFTFAALVGAAMCSACLRGSHDRWP